MEYSVTFKRKKILTQATMWKSLEDMTLSEIIQPRMTNTVWFHLEEASKVDKVPETESRMEVTKGLWGGRNGGLLDEYKVCFAR